MAGEMASLRGVVLCCFLALVGAGQKKRYDNYQVLRVVPKTEDELATMKEIQTRFPGQVDFWSEPTLTDSPIDIMVPPDLQAPIKRFLKQHATEYETIMDNVQAVIDKQIRDSAKVNVGGDKRSRITLQHFDYSVYHTLDEISDWMTFIVTSYPNLTEKFTVTQSYQGRDVHGIKVRKLSSRTKPAVYFEGGIHSREWISHAAIIYFIKELVEKYDKDRIVKKLVDSFDWYMVPVLNPDGYVYTWTTDRLWRKSLQPNVGHPCIGTDLNRNWDFHWSAESYGASSDPCSPVYRGDRPNSTPEVNGTQAFLANLHQNQTLALFVDWHSFNQMWLTPWAHTEDLPADYADHLKLTEAVVGKLTSVYGTRYSYGPASHIIYTVTGSTLDWVYGVLGVKHAYAVELRDVYSATSAYFGFLLPERLIIPTVKENWEASKMAAMYILENET